MSHRLPHPNSAFGHPTNLVLDEDVFQFPLETPDDDLEKIGILSFQQDMGTHSEPESISDATDIDVVIHSVPSKSNVNRATGFKNTGGMNIVGKLVKAPQQQHLTITVKRQGGSKTGPIYTVDIPIIRFPDQDGSITFHYDRTFAQIMHRYLEKELKSKKAEIDKMNPPKNKKGLR